MLALLLAITYFDAHNHITGILPYQAYANLPAFVEHFSRPEIAPRPAWHEATMSSDMVAPY